MLAMNGLDGKYYYLYYSVNVWLGFRFRNAGCLALKVQKYNRFDRVLFRFFFIISHTRAYTETKNEIYVALLVITICLYDIVAELWRKY